MTALVTLEEAKTHLRLLDGDHDDDVSQKVDLASAIVRDYLKTPNVTWTDQTAPLVIKAAVLIILGALFIDRESAGIPQNVQDMLVRFRDPALG